MQGLLSRFQLKKKKIGRIKLLKFLKVPLEVFFDQGQGTEIASLYYKGSTKPRLRFWNSARPRVTLTRNFLCLLGTDEVNASVFHLTSCLVSQIMSSWKVPSSHNVNAHPCF